MSEWEDDGRYFWDETLEVWYDSSTYDNYPEVREGNVNEYTGYTGGPVTEPAADVTAISSPDENFWSN